MTTPGVQLERRRHRELRSVAVGCPPPVTTVAAPGIMGTRCMLTGDPFAAGITPGDPTTSVQFNPGVFAMAQPVNATTGNFGNTPIGRFAGSRHGATGT